ncbi:hypothetical protein AAHZ94_14885 [Streptomyces sp. HSW2009]
MPQPPPAGSSATASQHALVLPEDDSPTNTTIRLAPPSACPTTERRTSS